MTNVGHDAAVGSASNNFSFTNSAAGNAILVSARDSTGTAVTAVSYGGVALTKLGFQESHGASGNGDGVTLWGKIGGLPTGANTVAITGFSTWADASSYTAPGSFGTVFKAYNADSGGDSTGSIALTGTTTGGYCVSAWCIGNVTDVTATGSAVVRGLEHINGDSASGNGWMEDVASVGGGSSTTIAWTGTISDWWGAVAVEILPASSSGLITAAVKMKKMTVSGSSTEKAVVTAAPKMKKMVITGNSKMPVHIAVSMKKMTVSGTSHEKTVASGGPSMKKMSVSGSSAEKAVASGGPSMKKMVLFGASEEVSSASAVVHLKKFTVSASSSEKSTVTAAVSMKKMGISASSAEKSVTTAAVSMKKMTVLAASTKRVFSTAAVHMHKMTISGSSPETSVSTGAVSMKKMGISAASLHTFADVSVHLKKMHISASSVETAVVATTDIFMKKMLVQSSGGPVHETGGANALFIFSPL